MRLPEGDTLANEVLGEVGGEHERVERRAHPLRLRLKRRQHSARDLERGFDRLQGVEEGLLVLLQVLVVRSGQALEHGQQSDVVADHPRALPAEQLGGVWVLLLWHERRASRVRVATADEAELLRAVHDEVLRKAREVHHQERRPRGELDDEVTITDGVDGVGRRLIEAELSGDLRAVDAERVASKRTGAERAFVHALDGLLEPVAVALPRPRMSKHPLAPADGLS
mmetsp:Transcript_16789/g.38474  ORF Transcript_16789/g.38474 Transcript_16789/m.38474 type:complete len:226 (+) Transcript_16789:739-1416(+)